TPPGLSISTHGLAPRPGRRRRATAASAAGFIPPGPRSGPLDQRRRIHFAAAEDASGGRGGREVERSETSVNPACATRREASHILAKGGPGVRRWRPPPTYDRADCVTRPGRRLARAS